MTSKTIITTLKSLAFLALGAFLFWYIYKDINVNEIKLVLHTVNWGFIVLAIVLGLLSMVSRALRWNIMLQPMGYKPKFKNTLLSVLVLYFVNLIIPRAGEVARCTILAKYENIPVSKLLGTVFIERIAEFVMFLIIVLLVFGFNVGLFQQFLNYNPEIKINILKVFTLPNIVIGVIAIVIGIIAFIKFKPLQGTKIGIKIEKVKAEFSDGIKSIITLNNRWSFIAHTVFIYLLWLLSLYLIFLAYTPTQNLGINACVFTFVMAGLAMLAPVQGGIGAWHFMVMQSLFIFGIDKQTGSMFALIAHTSSNLIYLFIGMLAFVLFPVFNRSVK